MCEWTGEWTGDELNMRSIVCLIVEGRRSKLLASRLYRQFAPDKPLRTPCLLIKMYQLAIQYYRHGRFSLKHIRGAMIAMHVNRA
jgi:hypothetical protein